jgi:LysR family transcriptional regulator, glycine cleavage system transcriptional activator
MKRGRLPLTALRSFEVAGRLLSFTRAAEELFVSQAAVSRQIRELERTLGCDLCERKHRAVILTDAGRQLLATLSVAFDGIDHTLTAIRTTADFLHVTISAEPGFAAQWLVPSLPDFHALHPDVEVTVESDARLIAFRSGEARLAIRHSTTATRWADSQARLLRHASLVPIIAPALAKRGQIASPADLLSFSLLHEESRSLWTEWFASAGIDQVGPIRGTVLADCALVIQAAISGQGVALCDPMFARSATEDGLLVQPFGHSIDCGSYFIVARDFSRLPEGARRFADWLAACFRQENDAMQK